MPDRVLVDIEDPQDQLPRRASQERASCWSSDRAGEEPCGRRCSGRSRAASWLVRRCRWWSCPAGAPSFGHDW